jgi:hypothetical protein
MTDAQKATLRDFLAAGSGEFHHGDCIGADSEAHDIADECGYRAPAEPLEQPRGGTWSTIRFGLKQGRTVIIILPDGKIIK